MTYRTRHMVALKPHTYFGDEVAVGACFYATPVDGGYFIKIGRAEDAPEPQIQAPVSVAPPVAPPVFESVAEPAAVEPVTDEPAQEAAAEPEEAPVTAAPRRGRPPRNATQA
jgi:hypothetical protein